MILIGLGVVVFLLINLDVTILRQRIGKFYLELVLGSVIAQFGLANLDVGLVPIISRLFINIGSFACYRSSQTFSLIFIKRRDLLGSV